MPLQRKKHPRFRKREPRESKTKKEKVKKKQNIIELIPQLPQDVKDYIYTLLMKDRIPSWKLLHQKQFNSTELFLSMGLNPHYHYDFLCGISIDIYKNSISFKNKKLLGLNSKSKWTCSQIMKDEVFIRWENYEMCPGFDNWNNKLCERQVGRKSQNGIISIFIENNQCKDIEYREWENIRGKFWYHEKCRCFTCDRVRYEGRKKLSLKEREKFQDIVWDIESSQWKAKSPLEKKYEKNFAKIMVWSLLTAFWNEY
jgi:hypothetical protein